MTETTQYVHFKDENRERMVRATEQYLGRVMDEIRNTETMDAQKALALAVEYASYYADYELYQLDSAAIRNEEIPTWHNPNMRGASEAAVVDARSKGDFTKLKAFIIRDSESGWGTDDPIVANLVKISLLIPKNGDPVTLPPPAYLDQTR